MSDAAAWFHWSDCLFAEEPATGRGLQSGQDPLRIAAVVMPTVVTMSTSCTMKDDAMGVTYMDTMTTSVGQVTLSGSKQKASTQGPIIEDIMDRM